MPWTPLGMCELPFQNSASIRMGLSAWDRLGLGQGAPRHPFLELQTPQFASRHKNQADRAWKRKGRRKGVSKTCVHAASLRGEGSTTWLKWFGGTRRAPR